MASRTVKEWIGKTPDSRAPASVMLRVKARYNDACYLSGVPIRPGDKFEMEHIVSLSLGGENRESNLAPALPEPHKRKTAAEAAIRAKADNMAKASHGLKPVSKNPIEGPKFKPSEPRKSASRPTEKQPAYGQSEIARRYGL